MRCSTVFARVGLAVLLVAFSAAGARAANDSPKLGPLARQRAARSTGWSRVIIQATSSSALSQIGASVERVGGTAGRSLPLVNGRVAYVPNSVLSTLADDTDILRVSLDRAIVGTVERTDATVGVNAVRSDFGYDGAGIGVAVIDSGITSWHDDLTGGGGQRVVHFVDFVGGGRRPYDDYGHGTHVSGIIAGNGFDSGGRRTGVAPGAHLLVLKALDGHGGGHISDVIAALDYAVANRHTFNIRVINLSVAAGVFESYTTDPLTIAAKRAVDAGIVVVAAAGNLGRNGAGKTRYGSVTAPGNAPWVLTVGASSHMGTKDRMDDTIAGFSSRGPTLVDFGAKPDLVAPGVGIESLSDPASALYTSHAKYLLSGTVETSYLPYLSLSGTSMAAPVVSGTVALMLQANPELTPNAVKAILQYTAQAYDYDALTQGTGFLNALGAVELARYMAASTSTPYPSETNWSTHITWGTHRIGGGQLTPAANAWALGVTWGAFATPGGEPVAWGVTCSKTTCDPASAPRWEARCGDALCSSAVWGGTDAANVVWGTLCGGDDCHDTWSLTAAGSTVVGTSSDDTVVWGSSADDTVVWGSSADDTVVWGSSADDTVVWGSSCSDPSCEPIIWNTTEP